MKHILLTIGALERGGAELRLLELLRAVRRKDLPVRITAYVISGRRGQLDEEFRAADVTVIYGKPRVAGFVDVGRLCRREKIDVLHANWDIASGLYCFAAWAAGVPHRISHVRSVGNDRNGVLQAIRNSIYRLFLNAFSTCVIGVCDGARAFTRTPRAKWRTIYDGIDVPPLGTVGSRNAPDSLSFLFLGRVRPAKNPLKAVRIMDAMRRFPGRRAKLHVVGRADEELAQEMKRQVEVQGLQDVIVFEGPTAEPYRWLCQSSALLLTSIREGLPGVVLEALACGTPVVASDLPGAREIADRVPGVTVLPASAPDEQWAQALLKAADQSNRQTIAAAFRHSPFMIDVHVDEVVGLWLPTEEATQAARTLEPA